MVVFGMTGPICRGETETLESYVMQWGRAGSELDSHNTQQNAGSAWVRDPSISFLETETERGADLPRVTQLGDVLLGSLMLKNLIELESLSLLPHPVNNRHSISICGMYEARGDAGAKQRGLGTVGRPGRLVTPWACLRLLTVLSPGWGWGVLGG